jgi:hypothetical protein
MEKITIAIFINFARRQTLFGRLNQDKMGGTCKPYRKDDKRIEYFSWKT